MNESESKWTKINCLQNERKWIKMLPRSKNQSLWDDPFHGRRRFKAAWKRYTPDDSLDFYYQYFSQLSASLVSTLVNHQHVSLSLRENSFPQFRNKTLLKMLQILYNGPISGAEKKQDLYGERLAGRIFR